MGHPTQVRSEALIHGGGRQRIFPSPPRFQDRSIDRRKLDACLLPDRQSRPPLDIFRENETEMAKMLGEEPSGVVPEGIRRPSHAPEHPAIGVSGQFVVGRVLIHKDAMHEGIGQSGVEVLAFLHEQDPGPKNETGLVGKSALRERAPEPECHRSVLWIRVRRGLHKHALKKINRSFRLSRFQCLNPVYDGKRVLFISLCLPVQSYGAHE
jgi:hypothetical protein